MIIYWFLGKKMLSLVSRGKRIRIYWFPNKKMRFSQVSKKRKINLKYTMSVKKILMMSNKSLSYNKNRC